MPGNFSTERDYQLFIKEQTAFVTPAVVAATDALRFKTFEASVEESREARPDLKGTRSMGATVIGKRNGTWSAGGPYSPSGSLGVESDIGVLLKHAMGTQFVTGGTKVDYTLLKDIESTLFGLTMQRNGNHFSDIIYGALVNEFSFTINAEGLIEWAASGPCINKGFAGTQAIQTTISAGSTTVGVDNDSKYGVKGVIDIGTSTGHTITSISPQVLTFTPGVVGSQAAGLLVKPSEPTGVVVGSPVHGVAGSVTIDGPPITIIGGNVTINNNLELRNNEYGGATATGFRVSGQRTVSLSLELHLTNDLFKFYGHAFNNTQKNIHITLGDTAGRKTVIVMNKVEFTNIPGLPVPEGGEATFTLEGKALPTNTEDEITITEQ